MNPITPEKRVKLLINKENGKGNFVLYWMQSSQRTENNWALHKAIETANNMELPVVAYFGLNEDFPEANQRHYWFMLEGLQEVYFNLKKMGIKMMLKKEKPAQGVIDLSKKASLIIVDKGYLKRNSEDYKYAAEKAVVPLIQVEDNVIVPVEEASQKEEYSAATMRPKILSKLNNFLELPPDISPKKSSLKMELESIEISDLDKTISSLNIDKSVNKSDHFRGGTSQAKKLIDEFIEKSLEKYEEEGNNPENNATSNLSPYLHFGQISPIHVSLKILRTNAVEKHKFLEQLIIRRELAINFVYYNKNYDSFLCLPEWAKKTLTLHTLDERKYNYTLKQLENAQTHDQYWNAAQKEMLKTGKMNGYMRMYWGKKIIEWTKKPDEAFKTALYLNNKYEIDGRDPNGYTGVAWCFGKHDRPWSRRAIFGNVRYMNDKGLERKFDMQKYLQRVNSLQ